MAIYDNKKYLNLQETVEWCKDQIQGFKNVEQIVLNYGIKVLGQVDSPNDIPEREYEYGDAYLVGTETPYDIYIFTRDGDNNEGVFINLGAFAIVGPAGPAGPAGVGTPGIRGSRIFTGMGSPTSQSFDETPLEGDIYIRGDQGYQGFVYTYHLGDWDATINIRGPQGATGTGVPGPRGPAGVGIQGLKGDPGQSFVIMGTITSTSQLPDPEEAPRNEAYILKGEPAKLYFITGEDTLQWSNVDIGAYGTTILSEGAKIDSINKSDLINDQVQILGNDVYQDDTYGLVITGNLYTAIGSDSKEIENAGAYTMPIQDSSTIKVDVANNKFTLNLDADMTAKISKALVTPNTAPTATSLVAIDTANSQTMYKIATTFGNSTVQIPTNKVVYDYINNYNFTNQNSQNSFMVGNMKINFGKVGDYSSGSGLGTYNVTFKTSFNNTNYWIIAVPDPNTTDTPQSYDYTGMVKVSNRTATGCTFSVNYVAGNKRGVSYIAIGT